MVFRYHVRRRNISGLNVSDENTQSESKLDLAGYAYAAGDAALVISGLMDKNWNKAASGSLYLAGAGVLARYGREKGDHQLKELCHRMRGFLDENKIAIPEKGELATALEHRNSMWQQVERFLYKYPSQILNALFAVGGVQLFQGGWKKDNKWLAASGALVAAGALAGLLIPEKQDGEKPPEGMAAKAWSWVRENPLPIAGSLYMANNATTIMAALKDRKTNPENKSYLLLFVTSACYVAANLWLTHSHKTQSKNAHKDDTVTAKLEDIAARVVAAQPEAMRTKVIEDISNFMAKQPEVKLHAGEIAKGLEQRIGEIARSNAHKSGNWQDKVAPSDAPLTPSPTLG